MKKLAAVISALMLSVCLCANSFAAGGAVKIDMKKTHQTIDGFGAAYTWYLERLTKNSGAEEAYDWTFSEAGFNILRFIYPKPDSSGPTTIENCKLVYDAAVERGVDPLVLITHCGVYVINEDYSEFTVDSEDSTKAHYVLKKDENGEFMYDVFAEHCVQVIKDFENAGIPVDYFSFTNEVEWQIRDYQPWKEPEEYASFYFGPEETDCHPAYWKQYIAIYDAFEREFGDGAPEIIGTEVMNGSLDKLKPYLDPLIEARPDIMKTIGFHIYGTEATPETFAAVGEEYPEYKKWQTEWCSSDYFTNAEIIIDMLTEEDLNAYLYWNGIWDFDEGECLIEASGSNSELKRNGCFYMMEHFSSFIKRGYLRVDTSGEYNSKVAAFRSPDGSKLVAVIMNPAEEPEKLDLDLGDSKVIGSKVYQSTEGENNFKNEYLKDLGECVMSETLPARSLTTIVFDLEPDPNYVPAAEESVGSSGGADPVVIAVIAVGAVIVAAAVIAVVIAVKKKN